MMAPKNPVKAQYVDVTEAMNENGLSQRISLDVFSNMYETRGERV